MATDCTARAKNEMLPTWKINIDGGRHPDYVSYPRKMGQNTVSVLLA
jgi:hypothetical protein